MSHTSFAMVAGQPLSPPGRVRGRRTCWASNM